MIYKCPYCFCYCTKPPDARRCCLCLMFTNYQSKPPGALTAPRDHASDLPNEKGYTFPRTVPYTAKPAVFGNCAGCNDLGAAVVLSMVKDLVAPDVDQWRARVVALVKGIMRGRYCDYVLLKPCRPGSSECEPGCPFLALARLCKLVPGEVPVVGEERST